MKKLILTVLLAIGMIGISFAQHEDPETGMEEENHIHNNTLALFIGGSSF